MLGWFRFLFPRKSRERKTMADGWCTGQWYDVYHWVHPHCREVGLPHEGHYVEER